VQGLVYRDSPNDKGELVGEEENRVIVHWRNLSFSMRKNQPSVDHVLFFFPYIIIDLQPFHQPQILNPSRRQTKLVFLHRFIDYKQTQYLESNSDNVEKL
jgi:hypothetical protein